MKQTNITVDNGVVVPQEAVEGSNIKKAAHRTLRQLPIYRDMANLKYCIVKLYDIVPRKQTKFVDTTLNTCCEAKKCVGLAEATRIPEMRIGYLDTSRIFCEDIQDDITILRKLNLISKISEKRMKSLAKAIIAQCVAWRDYENTQGVNSETIERGV